MSKKHFEVEIIENANAKNMFHSTCFKTLNGWFKKWIYETGKNEQDCICSYFNCTNNASTGVHLWLKGKPTKYYFIAPICLRCNNKEKQERYFKMKPNIMYLKTNVNPCIHLGYEDEEDEEEDDDEENDTDDSNFEYESDEEK